MAEYETLNRALDAQLVARGLREQIRMMGGDLVSTSQRAWFAYIAANMNDLFDAYSVHVYWDYWNTPFFKETRLKDIRRIVTEELPASARKPTYVMEFGVRGKSFPGKPNVESGYWDDGTDIARTNVAAFQQLWFDLAAAQLGFTGSVKWDAYWGRYHGTYNSLYSLIGPASEGWPLFPGYHATNLLLQTTARGWQVLQVGPWNEDDWKFGVIDNTEKELAAYAGDGGQLTLMGLDSRGRDLNTTSPESAGVQHRRIAGRYDVQPRALERRRRRQELDRGHRDNERRRRGALRGAAACGLLADDRPCFLRGSGGARLTAPRRQDWLSSPLTPQVSESR